MNGDQTVWRRTLKKRKKKKEVIIPKGQLEQFGKQYVMMKMKNRKKWTRILHIKADLTLHRPKFTNAFRVLKNFT